MTLLKRLEAELTLDWRKLQAELVPETKSVALKDYQIKFALYRKARVWAQELGELLPPVLSTESQ